MMLGLLFNEHAPCNSDGLKAIKSFLKSVMPRGSCEKVRPTDLQVHHEPVHIAREATDKQETPDLIISRKKLWACGIEMKFLAEVKSKQLRTEISCMEAVRKRFNYKNSFVVLIAPVAKRNASSNSRNASKPASLVIFVPWNSNFSLLSN